HRMEVLTVNQDCCGRSWMYALGGVALLASSIAGFSLIPAGCGQASSSHPTVVPAKGLKGTKGGKIEPEKSATPSDTEVQLEKAGGSPGKKHRPTFKDRSASGSKEA